MKSFHFHTDYDGDIENPTVLIVMEIARSLCALQTFKAAARHESPALATDELDVSSAVISQLIRGLKTRLGDSFD